MTRTTTTIVTGRGGTQEKGLRRWGRVPVTVLQYDGTTALAVENLHGRLDRVCCYAVLLLAAMLDRLVDERATRIDLD